MILYIYIYIAIFITYSPARSTDENLANELEVNEASECPEPLVKPKIVNIDSIGTTQFPAKFKNYIRRKAMIELQRKFQSSMLLERNHMPEDDMDFKFGKNNFGVDSEIYLCKKSPGKNTSESRLCQIDSKPKCQCVASKCEFFKTFSQKSIYRCVIRR